MKNFPIDHLCYRTDSLECYEKSKKFFSTIGHLLIEGPISGRPIATYKLLEPIHFENYSVDVVEVPAPKVGKETPEGFEHIELVIDTSFDHFIEEHPHLTFDRKGLSKEHNKELAIKLEAGVIKLHHMTLEDVIKHEKANL